MMEQIQSLLLYNAVSSLVKTYYEYRKLYQTLRTVPIMKSASLNRNKVTFDENSEEVNEPGNIVKAL